MNEVILHFSIASDDPGLRQYRVLHKTLNNIYAKIAAMLWALCTLVFLISFVILIFQTKDIWDSIGMGCLTFLFAIIAYEAVIVMKGKPAILSENAFFIKDYLSLVAEPHGMHTYTFMINSQGIEINGKQISFQEISKVETVRHGNKTAHFMKIILHADVVDLMIWKIPRRNVYFYGQLLTSKETILIPEEVFTQEQKERFLQYIREHTKLGTIQIV